MKKNKPEQKSEIIKEYIPEWYQIQLKQYPNAIKDIIYFEDLPPSKTELMNNGYPNIKLSQKQNYSPTARKIISIAKKNDGLLGGYMIPVESGRDDARITIETLYLPVSDKKAEKIKEKLCKIDKKGNNHCPDEFSKEKHKDGKEYYRYWWD